MYVHVHCMYKTTSAGYNRCVSISSDAVGQPDEGLGCMHTHFLLWIDLISHGNLVYNNRIHAGVRLG